MTSTVYKTFVCALLTGAIFIVAGVIPTSIFEISPVFASADSYSSLPTIGGEPAFATKADGMVSTVESHLQSENYTAAKQASAELTEMYPEFLKGWMLLGYCCTATSDFAGSNVAYGKAIELGADKHNVLSRMAYNHIRLGEYDDAKDCYRTILESNREDIDALKQLGYLESKLGNFDAASHYYKRVLDADPENADVIVALAKVEAKRGGNGTVADLLEKAIELDPENTEFLGKLGVVYIKEKKFEKAIDPLNKLVALEPENVNAYRNLGVAHYKLNQKKKARDAFEKYASLGGEMDDLYGPLVDCYMSTGQTASAVETIKEGIGRGSQEAWLYSLWGKILEKSKNYDGAIEKFSKAVQLQEEPWSDYARKQIARQSEHIKREKIMASQMSE